MTPHNEANIGDIAKNVIMPGDPNRVEFIKNNYLENPKLVNKVRGILAYTGTYKGKNVTVMASGMGMPSMGIYATELFTTYEVDKIIRVGTCGSLKKDIKIKDILLADSAYTVSNYAYALTGKHINTVTADKMLIKTITAVAKKNNINLKEARINTSDIFYTEFHNKSIDKNNCAAVEMETFCLLFLAKHFKKKAASILTVSDSLVSKEKELTPEEREKSLKQAIVLALESL